MECAVCGATKQTLYPCEMGHICDPCLKIEKQARDTTTKTARAIKNSKRERATARLCKHAGDLAGASSHEAESDRQANQANEILHGALPSMAEGCGEAVSVNRPRLANTLKDPDIVALDACAHRLDLLDRVGTNCLAMALDAVNTIQAENSLEKMLAHQLTVAHKTALEVIDKAFFLNNPAEKARLINLSARLMETFQRGLLTLQRLRMGGEQTIIVKQVTVAEGGKAIVGNVRTGEKPK